MSTIVITDELAQEVIPCPVCGHEYTHHESTTIFIQDGGEDGPVRRIDVNIGGDTSIKSNSRDQSPSKRRDAMVLRFSCEGGCRFDLEFSQHKGQTFAGHTVLQRAEKTSD